MNGSNLVLAIVGMVSLALALGLAFLRPAPAPAADQSVGGARVEKSLDEISRSLERIEEQLRHGGGAAAPLTAERNPADGELRDVLRALRETLAALGGDRVQRPPPSSPDGDDSPPTPMVGTSPLRRLMEARTEPDWKAWDALADVYEADRYRATAQVQLSTPTDLLRRFGPPTDISRGQDGMLYFNYQDPPRVNRNSRRFSAQLLLVDGLVVELSLFRNHARSD